MHIDKVVLITGAGDGLGRELAKVFCDAQAKVIGLGRTESTLKETQTQVGAERFEYIVSDVGDLGQVNATVQKIISAHQKIDYLFNNAAVYPKLNFLQESPETFKSAIATNVLGVAYLCKAVLPGMVDRGYGRIYNLGSWADRKPIADRAVYSCSKGAIHPLTKAIAVDIAPLNVDVEVHEWIPGHLNTQMSEYTGMEPSIAAEWAKDLVLRSHPDNRSKIFVGNSVWEPPLGIKQKIKRKLMFWKKV